MLHRGRAVTLAAVADSAAEQRPLVTASKQPGLASSRRIMDAAIRTLVWMAGVCGAVVLAQDTYLPPKTGSRKPIEEPTMPANYDFSYEVQDNGISLDFGHNEKRKDNQASGSYHVLLPDGRMQLVEYEAGPDGYKPIVTYMGTATFPAAAAEGDKFDGYHYNAASNRESVRRPAPRAQPAQQPPAPHAEPPARPAAGGAAPADRDRDADT